jgi:phosphatidylethanolamine/phosphatidyl-N-methylethanolamine N-methyltransferase
MAKQHLSFAQRIEDEFRFVGRMAANPAKVGAVSPTSRALARLMARLCRPDPAGYALELGPGTGVVTQALIDFGIPPERIVSVEYDEHFARLLRARFPTVNVLHGDALDLDRTLGDFRDVRFSAAASSLPLLTLPKPTRLRYLEGVFDHLVPGGVVSQLSYSLLPPQEPVPGRLAVDKSRWVAFNLPPGRAWIYRRV